jgi:hypothetical protein
VSCYTVWLKTLNLALMGGTPQYIHFFIFIDFVFTFIFIFIFGFIFLVLLVCFLFRDKGVFQFKFGGVL